MGCSNSSISSQQEENKIYVDKSTYISDKFEMMLYINVENELCELIQKKEFPSHGFMFNRNLYRERKYYFENNGAAYYIHLYKYREIVEKVMNNYGNMYTVTTIFTPDNRVVVIVSIVRIPGKQHND